MKTITMLEFRKNALQIIKWAKQGKRMIMTYRGRPVLRLEPYNDEQIDENDPFLQLEGIITNEAESLTNEEMDRIIYEY